MNLSHLCSTAALVTGLLDASRAHAADYACHPRTLSQGNPLRMQITADSLVLSYTKNATFVGTLKEGGRTLQFDRFRSRTPDGKLGVSVEISATFYPDRNELSVLDYAGWPTEYFCEEISDGL